MALNLSGLSIQISAAWVYVSDGTYKECAFGNTARKIIETANKEISKLLYKSELAEQALKILGKRMPLIGKP